MFNNLKHGGQIPSKHRQFPWMIFMKQTAFCKYIRADMTYFFGSLFFLTPTYLKVFEDSG
jgi:hypothetical protein